MIVKWKFWAKQLITEIHAIYLAAKDPRVPWYGKAMIVLIITYAFSPIDLIPDFIPVIGYLDDLLIIPLGIALVLKVIPPDVLAECRKEAQNRPPLDKPANWTAAVVIIMIWLLVAVGLGVTVYCRSMCQ